MTKPRPDQPGRCPSIDPHDTLQCTRAIHDDDQCRAGGIAWRKGSPRIEWDLERCDCGRVVPCRHCDPTGQEDSPDAGHRCEPYYSRAECGQCGWQEQWCVTCSRKMCGCATDTMGADQ